MLKLQIFPSSARDRRRTVGIFGASRPSIDSSKCNGCGVCVRICCFGALSIDCSKELAQVDSWRCEGCFACEHVCSQYAISRLSMGVGTVYQGKAATGPIVYGQLVPGRTFQESSSLKCAGVRIRLHAMWRPICFSSMASRYWVPCYCGIGEYGYPCCCC